MTRYPPLPVDPGIIDSAYKIEYQYIFKALFRNIVENGDETKAREQFIKELKQLNKAREIALQEALPI